MNDWSDLSVWINPTSKYKQKFSVYKRMLKSPWFNQNMNDYSLYLKFFEFLEELKTDKWCTNCFEIRA